MNPLLNFSDAGRLAGVSSRQIVAAVAAGRLPVVQLNRRRYVPRAAVERFLLGERLADAPPIPPEPTP